MKIKKQYIKTFPTDELGQEINSKATFEGLLYILHTKPDEVYDYIGVGDSIVREGCFSILADKINRPYDYIYNMWLNIE